MFRPVLIVICAFLLSACGRGSGTPPPSAAATDMIVGERANISTVDGVELTYVVNRPVTADRLPLLLVVDGSGCAGSELSLLDELFRPETDGAPYAKLFVEKVGVTPMHDPREGCTEDFLRHFSIDQRVVDHLRVLQHLRATADWWDGRLWVWGWSDGGDIAARLVSYHPGVERAVLGGMGGGTTMREQFRDDFICPETGFDTTEDRDACLADLDAQFARMIDNPGWRETWSGADNSFKVWETRLDARLSHILADTRIPLLIVHGAEDVDSVPVSSARRLVADLQGSGADITYWEVPGMAHTPGSLGDVQADRLRVAMRDWMMTGRAEMPVGAAVEPSGAK